MTSLSTAIAKLTWPEYLMLCSQLLLLVLVIVSLKLAIKWWHSHSHSKLAQTPPMDPPNNKPQSKPQSTSNGLFNNLSLWIKPIMKHHSILQPLFPNLAINKINSLVNIQLLLFILTMSGQNSTSPALLLPAVQASSSQILLLMIHSIIQTRRTPNSHRNSSQQIIATAYYCLLSSASTAILLLSYKTITQKQLHIAYQQINKLIKMSYSLLFYIILYHMELVALCLILTVTQNVTHMPILSNVQQSLSQNVKHKAQLINHIQYSLQNMNNQNINQAFKQYQETSTYHNKIDNPSQTSKVQNSYKQAHKWKHHQKYSFHATNSPMPNQNISENTQNEQIAQSHLQPKTIHHYQYPQPNTIFSHIKNSNRKAMHNNKLQHLKILNCIQNEIQIDVLQIPKLSIRNNNIPSSQIFQTHHQHKENVQHSITPSLKNKNISKTAQNSNRVSNNFFHHRKRNIRDPSIPDIPDMRQEISTFCIEELKMHQ